MRLDLTLAGGVIPFSRVNEDGEYPYLIGAGTLRMAARGGRYAGLGVGESPSIEVRLQNNARQVMDVLGTPPLRAPATLYDDAGEVFFEGIVSKVVLGRVVILTLES